MHILKNGLRYISSWLNMSLDSKFHVAMMFGGWGNREQTHNLGICLWKNTRENEKWKNRTSSCFKLTQMMPGAKVAEEKVDKHTNR